MKIQCGECYDEAYSRGSYQDGDSFLCCQKHYNLYKDDKTICWQFLKKQKTCNLSLIGCDNGTFYKTQNSKNEVVYICRSCKITVINSDME